MALTPPSATFQQEFSICKRASSLAQTFLSKWTKVAADYICEGRKREREEEGRKEERRKGSLGQQNLLLCGSALAECNAGVFAPYHS